MIILKSFPSTVLGGLKMWKQMPVHDLQFETPLLPALLGAHHCGTLPTLLLWPAKGNKIELFGSLVHLQH